MRNWIIGPGDIPFGDEGSLPDSPSQGAGKENRVVWCGEGTTLGVGVLPLRLLKNQFWTEDRIDEMGKTSTVALLSVDSNIRCLFPTVGRNNRRATGECG